MARTDAPEEQSDPTAAAEVAALGVPPEVVGQTLGQYVRGWAARARAGGSGMLPVVAGLVLIIVIFQAISPHHVFLSAGNLTNLFQQSAVFMVLAMAEVFAL